MFSFPLLILSSSQQSNKVTLDASTEELEERPQNIINFNILLYHFFSMFGFHMLALCAFSIYSVVEEIAIFTHVCSYRIVMGQMLSRHRFYVAGVQGVPYFEGNVINFYRDGTIIFSKKREHYFRSAEEIKPFRIADAKEEQPFVSPDFPDAIDVMPLW